LQNKVCLYYALSPFVASRSKLALLAFPFISVALEFGTTRAESDTYTWQLLFDSTSYSFHVESRAYTWQIFGGRGKEAQSMQSKSKTKDKAKMRWSMVFGVGCW
jgi:hypothetical protein